MHLSLLLRGGGSPILKRRLEIAPGGLIIQQAGMPKGQYDWNSDSSVEITIAIREISRQNPNVPKMPPQATWEADDFNRVTKDTLQSISMRDRINPSSIAFLEPEEPEVPETPGILDNGVEEQPRRTRHSRRLRTLLSGRHTTQRAEERKRKSRQDPNSSS